MYPHDFSIPSLIHKSDWDYLFGMMDMGWPKHRLRIDLQQIEHPKHGLLTAIRSGDFWMVFSGEYIDAAYDTEPPRFYPSTKLVNMNDAVSYGVDPYL